MKKFKKRKPLGWWDKPFKSEEEEKNFVPPDLTELFKKAYKEEEIKDLDDL